MKQEIFKKAWEIAKNGKNQFGGNVKSYFSESLKIAWKQAKTGENMEHKITLKNGIYNERRWSKPWLAIVKVDESGKPHYQFDGIYLGDHGRAGEVFMKAETGAIIAYGQKDGRGKGTINTWAKVVGSKELIEGDGTRSLEDIPGLEPIEKGDAVRYLMGL